MKLTRLLAVLAIIFVASSLVVRASPSRDDSSNHKKRQVKVMVITMFEIPGPVPAETQLWIAGEHLTEAVTVPGLSPNFPQVFCTPSDTNNRDQEKGDSDVCVVTTDIGFANAASSTMALILSDQFDFTNTYFLIAGIAGVDPLDGTLGSAAWARFAIDRSLSHEIDAREMPADWTTGHFGFGPVAPGVKPTRTIGTEVYRLNEDLLQKAYALTKDLDLTVNDNQASKNYRLHWPDTSPAHGLPKVLICDSVSDNIYWGGALLSKQANEWAALLTDGQANYCMTQEEDNSTLTALKRGSLAGRLNFDRIAVLRTAADIDSQYPGQTAHDVLFFSQGGFIPSVKNAYLVGSALVHDVVANWEQWKEGVPAAGALTVHPK